MTTNTNINKRATLRLMPTHNIAFVFNYDTSKKFTHVTYETEPVYDRISCGFSTYLLVPETPKTISEIIEYIQSLGVCVESLMVNKVNRYLIEFTEFKKLCGKFKATEIKERFIKASDEDLLKDIEYMHDETDRIEMLIDQLKKDPDKTRHDFYHKLLYNNTHRIFGFDNSEQYDSYVKKLNELALKMSTDSNHAEYIDYIKDLSAYLWDDNTDINTDELSA